MSAYLGAACNSNATGHGGMCAYRYVVADLNQIVQLDAVFDNGISERTTIYAGICPNFNPIADSNRTKLLNF